jgi:hypothetical protein
LCCFLNKLKLKNCETQRVSKSEKINIEDIVRGQNECIRDMNVFFLLFKERTMHIGLRIEQAKFLVICEQLLNELGTS